MAHCKTCGAFLEDDDLFCPDCGNPVVRTGAPTTFPAVDPDTAPTAPADICASCGATLPPDARFCGECGHSVPGATDSGATFDFLYGPGPTSPSTHAQPPQEIRASATGPRSLSIRSLDDYLLFRELVSTRGLVVVVSWLLQVLNLWFWILLIRATHKSAAALIGAIIALVVFTIAIRIVAEAILVNLRTADQVQAIQQTLDDK